MIRDGDDGDSACFLFLPPRRVCFMGLIVSGAARLLELVVEAQFCDDDD